MSRHWRILTHPPRYLHGITPSAPIPVGEGSAHRRRVVPELDHFPIEEAARMLLERHGSIRAERYARTIARALELDGDDEGAATWRRILEEVRQRG